MVKTFFVRGYFAPVPGVEWQALRRGLARVAPPALELPVFLCRAFGANVSVSAGFVVADAFARGIASVN